jgi:Zn-dependent protease with chaperone function
MKEEAFEIKDFNLDGKTIKLRYFPNKILPIAHSGGIGKIQVDKIFYEKFSYPQQKATIYHEIGHKKTNSKTSWRLIIKNKIFLIFLGLFILSSILAFYFNLFLLTASLVSIISFFILTLRIIIGMNNNKTLIEQEFIADEYSAEINKKDILSALIKIKELIERENLPYNLTNHPSIEERIKRVRELK